MPCNIEFAYKDDRILFQTLFVPPARARFQKWHLVVDTHRNSFYSAFNTLRAYMHHGPGFGNTGPKIWPAERNDIFFGLSEAEYRYIESVKPGVFGNKRLFFPVGFPKSDAFYQGCHDRQEILDELGLPDLPTILITSHWQKWAILRCLNEAPLFELAKYFKDHNIIQTGHDWLWNDHQSVPQIWREYFMGRTHAAQYRFSNTRFVRTSEVERLLSIADLLVCDSSSVMSTYCLLDRPIVFFDTPEANFATPELRSICLNASHPFTTIDELLPACRAALSSPTEKMTGRSTMRNTFFANEGQSAIYMARLIHSFAPLFGSIKRDQKRLVSIAPRP